MFTNNDMILKAAEKWRDDALSDGWSMTRTTDHEAESSACSLEKEGFRAMVLTRTQRDPKKWHYEVSLHVWGPDQLAIEIGPTYSWDAIRQGVETCSECRFTGIPTVRVGFANRVCEACRPAAAARIETPGWCN
jgi:hypothetical protein